MRIQNPDKDREITFRFRLLILILQTRSETGGTDLSLCPFIFSLIALTQTEVCATR